ncbi:MAG TPA: hypothetical protein GXX26_05500 [Clostridiaceae bacterium]|nr:hypothetical protein [Clostridiaceae bacterium]
MITALQHGDIRTGSLDDITGHNRGRNSVHSMDSITDRIIVCINVYILVLT